jgi:hypothetical protein
MLLVVGGLLLMSFVNVMRVDPGFATAAIVATDLTLPSARYPDAAARARFFDELLESIAAQPGIEAAGLVRRVPLQGEGSVDAFVADGDVRPIGEQPIASHVQVSPGYLSTIGLSLVHGRLLTTDDRGRDVAVISERAARTVWSSPQQALGRRFARNRGDVSWEVVGVVADARLRGLEREPGLVAYVPYGPRSTQAQLSLPFEHPLLEQAHVITPHQLKASAEVRFDPAVDVFQALRQALIHRAPGDRWGPCRCP